MSEREFPLKAGLDYGKELVESAYEGAREAQADEFDEGELAEELREVIEESWRPALIGACAGALVGYVTDREKSSRNVLAGLLVGAAVGFAGSLVWGSRHVTGTLAKGAVKGVGRMHDRRWLEKNPVVYG
jgi:hypothetical protein